MDAEQIEREYLEFCARVEKEAGRLMAMAHNKRDHGLIADAALTLADTAKTQAHQYRMQKERQDKRRYDLAALKVDAASASNSETGWEQED